MKKFLLFAFLALVTAISADAQRVVPMVSASNATVIDTVTNTASKTQNMPLVGEKWNTAGVAVKLTNISGTTAGVVRLYVSSDKGVSYQRPPGKDSVVISGATFVTGCTFVVDKYPWNGLRVVYTGAGTMSSKMSTTVSFK